MNLENNEAASGSIFAWDYTLWEVRLKFMAAGLFISLGVFFSLHYLSSWMSISYRLLPAKDKFFLSMIGVRGVFAIQSCAAGLWALLLDPVFQADKVYSQQDWSWFICLITSGFFLWENVSFHAFNFIFQTSNLQGLIHHSFAFGGFLGLVTNIKSGHYIPLMGMLLEMCTPFEYVSKVLMKVGRGNTLFWKANQWMVIHMFHCRMILLYHMSWVCISNWNAMLENLGLLHFALVFMGLSVLTAIFNPLWTYNNTERLFRHTNRAMNNVSPNKLSEETCQKKEL
ncbi:protein CLN8-like [Tiliqua scincoides]|uniref:protein CLN8-like n=1 Tax=Tiliqua scincoides TaxID=71010 RepID=UPI003462F6B3